MYGIPAYHEQHVLEAEGVVLPRGFCSVITKRKNGFMSRHGRARRGGDEVGFVEDSYR